MFELNDMINRTLTGEKIRVSANGEILKIYLSKDRYREFEVYAGIFFKGKFYFITHPVLPMQDVEENEAVVFNLIANNLRPSQFTLVEDVDILTGVFEEYYKLIDG